MESVVLETPDGISARLGWDPGVSVHDRRRILAKQLVANKLGVEEKVVQVDREAPNQFGFHTQLFAHLGDEQELAITIKTASFRAATVVAICEPGLRLGLDIRDLQPEEGELRQMRKHSHLFDEENVLTLTEHWTRARAVLEADARGARVKADYVRLDATLKRGWIPDRPVYYRLLDLSRSGWIITLAYEEKKD